MKFNAVPDDGARPAARRVNDSMRPPMSSYDALPADFAVYRQYDGDIRIIRSLDLVAKVGSVIERLREYRSALIAAAVTGRIDMRRGEPPP